MTDITDQDKREARKWAEQTIANRVNSPTDPWVIAARLFLANEEPPAPTLAEELREWAHRVPERGADWIKLGNLTERAEQIEKERDEARAEVERLVAGGNAATVASEANVAPDQQAKPDPADVPPGEPWDVVHSEIGKTTAVRRANGAPWYVVAHNGGSRYADHDEITLVSRLVPAPRVITDPDELDGLARGTVIRDSVGIVCERVNLGPGWFTFANTTDQREYIDFPVTVLWEAGE